MAHFVQINQLAPSTTGRSIIRTSAAGVPEYYAPGANNDVLTILAGVPTWSPVVIPNMTVAGDAGTNPSIVIGTDTLSILGGLGIDTTGNAGADSITIALNAALNDLTDTTIAGPIANQLLAYNGAQWVNTTGCAWLNNFSVDCLSDVNTSGVGVGDYLAWDGTNFVPTAPGGGFTSWTLAGDAGAAQVIGDLNTATFVGGNGIATTASATDTLTIDYDGALNNNSDVAIAAPAVNHILQFNGTDWVNVTVCAALGSASITCLNDVDTTGAVAGSILSLSGGGQWEDLGPGANGTVLTIVAGAPAWVAPADTTTVSDTNSINLTLTGLDITADLNISSTAGNLASINGTGLLIKERLDQFDNVADGTTVFNLTVAPMANTFCKVFRNGVLEDPAAFTQVGTVVTFTNPISTAVGSTSGLNDVKIYYFAAS